MGCFTHKTVEDVAFCCYCGKNLCEECVDLQTDRVLCKSPKCKVEMEKINHINQKTYAIYGEGSLKNIPLLSGMYIFFGLIMMGFAGFFITEETGKLLLLLIGAFLAIVGGVMFYRARKYKMSIW